MTYETIDVAREYLRKKAEEVNYKDKELADAVNAMEFCYENIQMAYGFLKLHSVDVENEHDMLTWARIYLAECLDKDSCASSTDSTKRLLNFYQGNDEEEECNGRNYKEARNSVSLCKICED